MLVAVAVGIFVCFCWFWFGYGILLGLLGCGSVCRFCLICVLY